MNKGQIERIVEEMRGKLEQDNRLGVLLSNADAQVVVRALNELIPTMPVWEVGDPKESVAVLSRTDASGAVVSTMVVQS